LTTGQKTLRIVMDVASLNINYLNFASNASSTNIALNKTATASSVEAVGNEASKAVDGSGTTRWSSAFSDPQWVSVDLGATYNVNRVKITWEAAYASAYQVQISSDGSVWNNMKSVTGNTTLVNDQTGLSGTGRYVRINGTARATAYGYSIFELEVYGTPTGARSISEEYSFGEIQKNKITPYPNPATDKVSIELNPYWIGGQISLININCTAVAKDVIKENTHTFDINDLPAGLYIITVNKGNSKVSEKVLKK
jgi:hypothetical protein